MKISLKLQLIIFLTLFSCYIAFLDRSPVILRTVFYSVIFSVTCESLARYVKEKKLTLAESSVISGQIIGIVLSGDTAWWVLCLACICAISSKYLLRFRGRHIFNPAGLGIFLSTLFLGATTAWSGTYLWYILAPFGIYFIYKIRKLEILASYMVSALFLFGIQATLQKVTLIHIFGYLSYFFIFIMLIEPKTTPITRRGKILFGSGVAALIFIFTEKGVRFDAELCTLLLFNLSVPILNFHYYTRP